MEATLQLRLSLSSVLAVSGGTEKTVRHHICRTRSGFLIDSLSTGGARVMNVIRTISTAEGLNRG
jgi:hypothetical protein